NTWRHVAFIEQDADRIEQARESGRKLVNLGMPKVRPRTEESTDGGSLDGALGAAAEGRSSAGLPTTPQMDVDLLAPGALEPTDPDDFTGVDTTPPDTADFRWLMSSDVCKHCTHAGCLDVCPTGALFRTEFDTVVVQDDICNGCGTCVAGCPFGVIERREDGTVNTKSERADSRYAQEIPNAGTANKCTLCYDRLVDDQTPACAQACPTESIRFGDRTEMVERAHHRVQELHAQGRTEARLYGANDNDGVGGTGAVFLLLDEPEVYGLPPDPQVPTANLAQMYKTAVLAAAGMAAAAVGAFLGGRT